MGVDCAADEPTMPDGWCEWAGVSAARTHIDCAAHGVDRLIDRYDATLSEFGLRTQPLAVAGCSTRRRLAGSGFYAAGSRPPLSF